MNAKKKVIGISLCLFVGSVLSAEIALQGDPRDIRFEIGATLGAWMPGIIYQGIYEDEKDLGFLLRVNGEYYVGPNFSVGAYSNLCPSVIDGYDASVVELGLAFKPRFFFTDTVSFKPGFNIGYRSIGYDSSAMWRFNSSGLALNLSLELQFHQQNGMIISAESGFLAQAVGGNDRYNVDFYPIWYFGVGAAIGVR